MTPRNDAVADLAEVVGRALITFAEQLRVEPTSPAAGNRTSTLGRGLGKSQQLVLDKLEAAGAAGLTATQVAEATELKETNTPRILKALLERDLVTCSEEFPAVWRYVEVAANDD